jgi:hypothetical protein
MTAPFDIIRKIARDAFRIDNVKYEPADVLTVAHDNDRSYVYDGYHYAYDALLAAIAKEGWSPTGMLARSCGLLPTLDPRRLPCGLPGRNSR